ncbi:MAG: hypothetical protein WCK16_04515 [Candidatus Moraniibacteriota bacterium]
MKKEKKIIKYSNGGFQVTINLLYDPKYPITEVVRLINISLKKVTSFYSAYGNSLDLNFPIDLLYRRADIDKYFEYKTERWCSGCCRKGKIALFHPDFFEIETSHKKEDFPKTLIHEISHMFGKKIFGEKYLWWVHEGVAQYIANQIVLKKIEPENINHFITNNLYGNNYYHDFTKQSGHQISKRIAFAIVDNYSEKALFELLKIEPGKNSKQAIATILKVPQKEIEKTIIAFLVE